MESFFPLSHPPKLTLAMIVRDGAADLPFCLASVRGIVDEIIIGDTGSSDGTAELAGNLGARVIPVRWTNDFAAARNAVLDAVRSDWVLVLDADERLDMVTRDRIHAHLTAGCDGFQVPIRNYVEQLDARLWDQSAKPNDGLLPEAIRFAGWLEHVNVRLFRNHPGIRFTGRVHETVGTSLVANGLRLGQATFLVHHLGFAVSAEEERRKHEFYLALGKQKLAEMPGDAQAHFEVGLEELTRGAGARAALPYFVQACRINARFALGWVFGAVALTLVGQFEAADEFLGQAESLGYESALLLELRADLNYRKGEYALAAAAYQDLMDRAGCPLPEMESKLGLSLWKLERRQDGLARMEHAIRAFPSVVANHDRLIAALVDGERLQDAIGVAEAKLTMTPPRPESYLRLASLYSRRGDETATRNSLRRGLTQFPDDRALRQAAQERKLPVPESKIVQGKMRNP